MVSLGSKPNGLVTVRPSAGSDVEISPPELTFDSSNWTSGRTFRVTAEDNEVAEGERHVSVAHTIEGGGYDASTVADIVVKIIDDEVPLILVIESDGSTSVFEATRSDSFDVVLEVEPPEEVEISLTADDQVTLSPAVLTFDPSNWDLPQTVTVEAVDDGIEEDEHTVEISLEADGTGYDLHPIIYIEVSVSDAGSEPPETPLSDSNVGEPPELVEPAPQDKGQVPVTAPDVGGLGEDAALGPVAPAEIPTDGLTGGATRSGITWSQAQLIFLIIAMIGIAGIFALGWRMASQSTPLR